MDNKTNTLNLCIWLRLTTVSSALTMAHNLRLPFFILLLLLISLSLMSSNTVLVGARRLLETQTTLPEKSELPEPQLPEVPQVPTMSKFEKPEVPE
ncbi:hypothetical protein CRYUN_Cryun10bG0099200 [Craigia yunnanensis]